MYVSLTYSSQMCSFYMGTELTSAHVQKPGEGIPKIVQPRLGNAPLSVTSYFGHVNRNMLFFMNAFKYNVRINYATSNHRSIPTGLQRSIRNIFAQAVHYICT